jgi:hypothetical protein
MLLPEHCAVKIDGQECLLAPSYVVSVSSGDGEYMLAVVCDHHKSALEERLMAMQSSNKIPAGKIKFEPTKAVVTDCMIGMNEDYVDMELKRGINSDRKM